jgi:hypothetical protein
MQVRYYQSRIHRHRQSLQFFQLFVVPIGRRRNKLAFRSDQVTKGSGLSEI